MKSRYHATHLVGKRFNDDYSPSDKFSNSYKNNGKRGKKRKVKRKKTLQELVDSNNAKRKTFSKNKIYIKY